MMACNKPGKAEEEVELRRGPWTIEEDTLLIHYIACHGEGRWNLLAKCSGLKRTGKSCRLRWLNYLKPDVKRGNLTPEEQILILELHSKWGNRWSRIAQHLPGRTDNEIKNYWRTRVQKHARQLKVDANSDVFRDALRCFWMPRLVEKMGASQQFQPIQPSPSGVGGSYEPPTAVGARFESQFNPLDEQQAVFGNNTNSEVLVGGTGYALGAAVGGDPMLGSAAGGGDSEPGCSMLDSGWGDGLWSINMGDHQLWSHLRQMHEWAL